MHYNTHAVLAMTHYNTLCGMMLTDVDHDEMYSGMCLPISVLHTLVPLGLGDVMECGVPA